MIIVDVLLITFTKWKLLELDVVVHVSTGMLIPMYH